MERKLATIEKISNINSIKDADNIEVATIKGWKVVVKKDDFKINDLVVYCEIDSVMPKKKNLNFYNQEIIESKLLS